MSSKLANYLRTYRRRSGLSQEDITFLLGCQSGTTLARYESCSRMPTLRTALVLEVILHANARELFAGLHEEAEQAVARRARLLLDLSEKPMTAQRSATLRAIAEEPDDAPEDEVVWEPIKPL